MEEKVRAENTRKQGEEKLILLPVFFSLRIEWRVPDLVGEVSDTTLATDLDEKKQLYADLEIPEYWVIDVRGKRAIAFRLQSDGKYQQCAYSVALKGLPIFLLEPTLERLIERTNISAASWFAQQLPI